MIEQKPSKDDKKEEETNEMVIQVNLTWYRTFCDNKFTTVFWLFYLSDMYTDVVNAFTMNVPLGWRLLLFYFVLLPFLYDFVFAIWDKKSIGLTCLSVVGPGFR